MTNSTQSQSDTTSSVIDMVAAGQAAPAVLNASLPPQNGPGVGRHLLRLLLGVCAALVPAAVSLYLHPWIHNVDIRAPHAIELPKNSLMELARVNSLSIYVTDIETFVTPRGEWPARTPLRDTFFIEVPPREAGMPPPLDGNIDWVAETIRRMFRGTLDPGDVRRASYEGLVSGDPAGDPGPASLQAAIDVSRALEPIDREVPYGDVLYYAVPPALEFAERTGTKHLFALAVQLSSQDKLSKYGWASPASLTGHINEALRRAKERGATAVGLPLIGAGMGDRSEPDVFKTLLAASFDEAESPGTLRAIYIGLFRRTPAAASALLNQFNVAWLNFYPGRRKVGELVDAPWRLTSLIALFAYVGLWYRWRARPAPRAVNTWHMTVAVLLIGRGLAEVVLLPLHSNVVSLKFVHRIG